MEFLDESWTKEDIGLSFSVRTYIENLIPKYEKLLNNMFKPLKTPMAPEYHPEVDDSPLLSEDDTAKYRSIIGSLNWLITLGRFDILYATNTLSRFSMVPREGHMEALQKMMRYIKAFPKGRILFDVSYPPMSEACERFRGWFSFEFDTVMYSVIELLFSLSLCFVLWSVVLV